MKNIKIDFIEKESKIKFDEYFFNGIHTPKSIEFKDITSNSLKISWKIDDKKIENVDNNKIIFRVEIRKDKSNHIFTKVYEGSNTNCLIENLKFNSIYEFRICSIYNNLKSEWSKKEKVELDFVDESIILNKEDKIKLFSWINPLYIGKNFCLKLIYRRGNDMSFETFHAKCDKQGPTLVICKAKEEKFGGYTNIDWESLEGLQKYQEGPFLFSLNKNKKYDYNYKNKTYNCIYLSKYNGPNFYWDFVFNDKKKMQAVYCCTKVYGFAYSNEPLSGDGSLKLIEVDEVEIFKVKRN
jgi:hypothetical protein